MTISASGRLLPPNPITGLCPWTILGSADVPILLAPPLHILNTPLKRAPFPLLFGRVADLNAGDTETSESTVFVDVRKDTFDLVTQ